MKMKVVSSNDFEEIASSITRRRVTKSSSRIRNCLFRSYFGTSSRICAVLWELLKRQRKRIAKKDGYGNVSPKHLLWALMFLKVYGVEATLSSMAGGVDEKTYRKWVWIFVKAIANLEPELVCKKLKFFIISF